MLTQEVKTSIEKSVLCWLATATPEGAPNVSPKEVFTYYGDFEIIIANIASPQSIRNIERNPQACVSFIDILVQKGFQIKGRAEIVKKSMPQFLPYEDILRKITAGRFPFSSVIKVHVEHLKPIIAPSYLLYPGTTEEEQIAAARKTYDIR